MINANTVVAPQMINQARTVRGESYVGIELHSLKMEARLPPLHVLYYSEEIKGALQTSKIKLRELNH